MIKPMSKAGPGQKIPDIELEIYLEGLEKFPEASSYEKAIEMVSERYGTSGVEELLAAVGDVDDEGIQAVISRHCRKAKGILYYNYPNFEYFSFDSMKSQIKGKRDSTPTDIVIDKEIFYSSSNYVVSLDGKLSKYRQREIVGLARHQDRLYDCGRNGIFDTLSNKKIIHSRPTRGIITQMFVRDDLYFVVQGPQKFDIVRVDDRSWGETVFSTSGRLGSGGRVIPLDYNGLSFISSHIYCLCLNGRQIVSSPVDGTIQYPNLLKAEGKMVELVYNNGKKIDKVTIDLDENRQVDKETLIERKYLGAMKVVWDADVHKSLTGERR